MTSKTSAAQKPSLVYVIACPCRRCGLTAVKIGLTRDLYSRVHTLQASNPNELSVLAEFESTDAARDESNLQIRFLDQHLRGEWFEATPDLLEYVEKLRGEGEARRAEAEQGAIERLERDAPAKGKRTRRRRVT